MLTPPQIRIFSPELVFIGEALGYTSAVYIRRWQSAGVFDISIPLDAFGAGQLRPGNIIMFDNDGHRTGTIHTVEIKEDAPDTLSVKGASLSGYCSNRYTEPPTDGANMGYDNVPLVLVQGVYPDPVSAETVIKEYAYRHMKRDPDRDFPELTIAPDLKRGMKIRWMSRFEELGEVLRKICEFCDIGYEIYLDTAQKRLVFDVIEGADRRVGSDSPVVFSTTHTNIDSMSYVYSLDGHKNLGYVGGLGENESRLIQLVWHGDKPVGRERREIFLDAGQISIADGLEDEGLRKLSGYSVSQSVSASLSAPLRPFTYRTDWDLGDYITIQSEKIGVAFDTRITEITERYDGHALGVIPTFGTPLDRLGRVIKRIETRYNVR